VGAVENQGVGPIMYLITVCLVPQRTQNLFNAVLAAIHSPCSMDVTTTWGPTL